MINLLQRATSFSARDHHGQFRKDWETPYVARVMRLAITVRHVFGVDDDHQFVLHNQHPFRLVIIDLNQAWPTIEAGLMDLLQPPDLRCTSQAA